MTVKAKSEPIRSAPDHAAAHVVARGDLLPLAALELDHLLAGGALALSDTERRVQTVGGPLVDLLHGVDQAGSVELAAQGQGLLAAEEGGRPGHEAVAVPENGRTSFRERGVQVV